VQRVVVSYICFETLCAFMFHVKAYTIIFHILFGSYNIRQFIHSCYWSAHRRFIFDGKFILPGIFPSRDVVSFPIFQEDEESQNYHHFAAFSEEKNPLFGACLRVAWVWMWDLVVGLCIPQAAQTLTASPLRRRGGSWCGPASGPSGSISCS